MERETTIAVTGNNRAFHIKCVAKHVDCIVGSNAKSIYSVTFAATVPALLPNQISLRVFPKRQLFTKDNTPPMPLSDAHLGGLFFLGHE